MAVSRSRESLTDETAARILVKITGVVFSLNSIPAIFAITTASFIVYTSNIFAILGLPEFYFAMVGIIYRLHCPKYGSGSPNKDAASNRKSSTPGRNKELRVFVCNHSGSNS